MSRRFFRAIWILVTLLAGSLTTGCDEANLNPGDPEIRVSPEVIYFRTLNLGETESQEILVGNIGTAPLRIAAITLDGPGAFSLERFGDQTFPGVTFPNGIPQPDGSLPFEKTVVVRFVPEALGSYQGQVMIESDDLLNPSVAVTLEGNCSVPDIQVTPAQLDFGSIGLDSSATLRLTVTNQGEADLYVLAEHIQLVSADPDSPFLFQAQDMQLEAGQEQQIEVNYSPREVYIDPDTHLVRPHQDSLLIFSNDPDESPVIIDLEGEVAANLPPVASVRIQQVTKTDGTLLDDPCASAPSDTMIFEGRALDPEGDQVQPNFHWALEQAPFGNTRPLTSTEKLASLTPGFSGEHVVCVKASDPQSNIGSYDPAAACTCEEAQAMALDDYDCPCMKFDAYYREAIRIELTWDRLGPDLDLHLIAPGGEFCSPSRECRFDTTYPIDPDWDRTACVDAGSTSICRTPNCDPVVAGCEPGQECFDDGGGPACWWQRCSGTDCFWAAMNPDWGVLGDVTDDPFNAIDCTHGCRAENTYLDNPTPGNYTIMVYNYEAGLEAEATIRIFFRGDIVPSATFTASITSPDPACHDTWTVATIDWVDQENHPVSMVNTHSCLECE